MDLYRKVRLACAEGMSQREAARHFNVSRDSVAKMMAFSVPPGYRRTAPVKRPKLDAYTGIIDGWLEGDRAVHRKQRHTAKRVFERLRDEHGFRGGYTIVKDYIRARERRGREMFVPLAHPPGHALNSPAFLRRLRASVSAAARTREATAFRFARACASGCRTSRCSRTRPVGLPRACGRSGA